jgi:hypothetical protein
MKSDQSGLWKPDLVLIREFWPDIKKTLQVRTNWLYLVSRYQPHWDVMDDGIFQVWKAS